MDDVNCWIYTYSWLPDRPFTNSEREKYAKGLSLHAEVDDAYVPVRNIHNDYMLDREKQFLGGPFDIGIFASRRSFHQKITSLEPMPAAEIGERQVLGEPMVGVYQRLHAPHGTTPWSNPVREFLGPIHHHIPDA